MLGATAGTAAAAALVFGLPPALRTTSPVPQGGRARTIFLGAQVAASCLLLVVSSLLASGIQRLRGIDACFDYQHLIWISPDLKAHGYGGPAAQAYLDLLRARTAGLPGVQAASVVRLAPWGVGHMDPTGPKGESGRSCVPENDLIGIGAAVTRRPLPHHRAYGSVHGGSSFELPTTSAPATRCLEA